MAIKHLNRELRETIAFLWEPIYSRIALAGERKKPRRGIPDRSKAAFLACSYCPVFSEGEIS